MRKTGERQEAKTCTHALCQAGVLFTQTGQYKPYINSVNLHFVMWSF